MIKDEIKEMVGQGIQNVENAEEKYLTSRSKLSKSQRSEIAKLREEYFTHEDPADELALSKVEKVLGALGVEIYKSYLPLAKNAYTPTYEIKQNFRTENRIAYFDITRWVNDKDEKNIDKLINVYQVLANEKCNIALIYERQHESCAVSIAIVNTSEESSDPTIVDNYKQRVVNAINGNFPGAEIKETDDSELGYGRGIPNCLSSVIQCGEPDKNGIVGILKAASVAIVTNLASDKSEDFISQSMEKLLDGIVPEQKKSYTLILLASPSDKINARKNRLYEIYNKLAPYATWQQNFTTQESAMVGVGGSVGKNIGADAGIHAAVHAGVNFGVSFGKTANYGVNVGKSDGVTRTCTNYAVKHALDLVEEQIKRLDECSALGMWEFAAYAISDDYNLANNVASMYLALTQGEKSYLSQSAINIWHGQAQCEDAACILESLKRLHHPQFILNPDIYREDKNGLMLPEEIELYTLVSGKELVRALNFPRKSVAGFAVIESAPFGREIQRFEVAKEKKDEDNLPDEAVDEGEKCQITVGHVVHMYKEEAQTVDLDVDSLTSHVFVTGSTGTGKSNAIYQILSSLMENGKKVLVIEPAKGEYKIAIGAKCHTYGTNPLLSEVLKINPFSFPTGEGVRRPIHILEHIDRLIEILNACWPMYAAMPAVLKDSVERAYINKGWDLYTSECYPLKFPTFADLLETLPEVMRTSLYSKDTQSDYAGALVTRINSLTNGINGLVFCAEDEISDEELFEQNVIIDISRVGSNETKSLLMGILIMKLQEHHMSSAGVNEGLHHVTVLEEAHNLLRRTSGTQSQESANLQGKSVEMLANSIAEMRTYGEGFIIADQAPGLLDESVIRNTNTKIILRLPDAEDRQLVGKATALKDIQIDELSKLPLGVAAVYQNDWVEAVLCQFERFSPQMDNDAPNLTITRTNMVPEDYFAMLFQVSDLHELSREDTDAIANWIDKLLLPTSTKCMMRKVLQGELLSEKECRIVAYNFFKGKQLAQHLRDSVDLESGIRDVDTRIQKAYNFENQALVTQIRQWILQYVSEHVTSGIFEKRYVEFMGRWRM